MQDFSLSVISTKNYWIPGKRVIFLLLAILSQQETLNAETFRRITGEFDSGAFIDDSGGLVEANAYYGPVYKPTPRAEWCSLPWIEANESFRGMHAVGMEIQARSVFGEKDVDKVNLTISTGHDPFALMFGNTRYTGFAVKFQPDSFQIPQKDRKLIIAQWWQGAPYAPPLSLAITGKTNEAISYEFLVKNDDTLGNPSVYGLEIGGGTISFGQWITFVIRTSPDFTGERGYVQVWVNGKSALAWKGKLGYNPDKKPYKGATDLTPYPNERFNVFIGPYRERQNKMQRVYFDEVKFTDSYLDAVP